MYQHAKWIIIRNKTYDVLRTKEGCHGFADLPAVDDDALNVKRGIIELGALEEDIIELVDCTPK